MPFNAQFWNSMTSRPDYYFWVFRDGDEFGGRYDVMRVGTGIQPTNRANYRFNAGTLAHEIGHHLGLGEHLAHFFDEAMALQPRGGVSALYRNSTMDWIMMEQAGQTEFMRAIFWGDDTYYRQIWYSYIYPVMSISYENMQLAREASMREPDRWRNMSESIAVAFEGAFDTRATQARRNQHISAARRDVDSMASWARAHNQWPYEAFLGHPESGIPMQHMLVPLN